MQTFFHGIICDLSEKKNNELHLLKTFSQKLYFSNFQKNSILSMPDKNVADKIQAAGSTNKYVVFLFTLILAKL